MSFSFYQEEFERSVRKSFEQAFEHLVTDLDFVQLHHDLKQLIKEGEKKGLYSIETQNNRSFVRIGELNVDSNYEYLLLSPFEGKHPNSTVETSDDKEMLSIQINDYFRHLHYIITFETNLTQIIIEKWAIDQNEVWINWSKEEFSGELSEFNYILKLLAFIGDSLYEMQE